jgi:hypothetical protein
MCKRDTVTHTRTHTPRTIRGLNRYPGDHPRRRVSLTAAQLCQCAQRHQKHGPTPVCPSRHLVLSFTASHLWPVRQDSQTSMATNVNAESRRSPLVTSLISAISLHDVMSQMAFAACLLAGLAPVVSSMTPLLFMDMEDVATVPPTWGKLIPRANTLQAQPQVNSKQLRCHASPHASPPSTTDLPPTSKRGNPCRAAALRKNHTLAFMFRSACLHMGEGISRGECHFRAHIFGTFSLFRVVAPGVSFGVTQMDVVTGLPQTCLLL